MKLIFIDGVSLILKNRHYSFDCDIFPMIWNWSILKLFSKFSSLDVIHLTEIFPNAKKLIIINIGYMGLKTRIHSLVCDTSGWYETDLC